MIENRLTQLLKTDKKILSIFVTAGFPHLEDTVAICTTLAESGAGLIELGIPFSDSIADGPTIQKANEHALANGANLEWTLETLREIRKHTQIPVLLMGSLNPIIQHGVERFCAGAVNAGADGAIIPDLPLEYYAANFRELFEHNNLSNIFLITPNTTEERIRLIDETTNGFIYAVSMEGVTGKNLEMDQQRENYLKRLKAMNLNSPFLVGFGIENRGQFENIASYSAGAIIGSAFLRVLENSEDVRKTTREFIARFG